MWSIVAGRGGAVELLDCSVHQDGHRQVSAGPPFAGTVLQTRKAVVENSLWAELSVDITKSWHMLWLLLQFAVVLLRCYSTCVYSYMSRLLDQSSQFLQVLLLVDRCCQRVTRSRSRYRFIISCGFSFFLECLHLLWLNRIVTLSLRGLGNAG